MLQHLSALPPAVVLRPSDITADFRLRLFNLVVALLVLLVARTASPRPVWRS
ncbi:hypothetical protein AB0K81_32550 [Streptomyces werraensis]|uniref:Uncharacterized protein n=1 Tax=Streptomyces werraensis TaxID=68284 RepID=A0ABV3JN38_9ACTN